MSIVIDASAVLAILRGEDGADMVVSQGRGAMLSTVNLAEILAKLSDLAVASAAATRLIERLQLRIVPFTLEQSTLSGEVRRATGYDKVSLEDRACLALAKESNATLLTADRKWAELDLGIDIRLIR